MAVGIKLKGWKDTATMLKELPDKVQRNVIKQAMTKGAQMLAERARASTHFKDRSGNLRKSIQVRRRKAEATRLGDDVVAKSRYAHLVENGWQRKTQNGTQHYPGTQFMQKALMESEQEILNYIESELRRFIERRLKKAAK
jgi:HK97 gp10 family phage protein